MCKSPLKIPTHTTCNIESIYIMCNMVCTCKGSIMRIYINNKIVFSCLVVDMNTLQYFYDPGQSMSSCYQQQTVIPYTKGRGMKVPHYILKVSIAMTEQHNNFKWSPSRWTSTLSTYEFQLNHNPRPGAIMKYKKCRPSMLWKQYYTYLIAHTAAIPLDDNTWLGHPLNTF